MIVIIPEDIPHRSTGKGTWIEAGEYELERILPNDRYMIIVNQLDKERTLTVVDKTEARLFL